MVVLEGGGMLSSSGNQYLQPDYLSPLPTTLDAKKSPLALLAQTCSQIGADSPPSKPLMSPMEKSKKSDGVRSSPAKEKTSTPQRSTPPETTKLAFKPYENNVVAVKKEDDRHHNQHQQLQQQHQRPSVKEEKRTENIGRKSASPSTSPEVDQGKTSPGGEKSSSSSDSARGASPIIRSGLEVLQGHPKDSPLGTYKPGLSSGLNVHFGSLCCPPEHSNPAFRPPFPGAAFPSPPMFSGYPGGPFLSYARVKTPSGGEALVPVCKDPYCTGCQFSPQNQQLLTGPCPSGCTQCDHQKYNLAMAMSLVPPGAISSSTLAYSQLGRPYVCNWIAGDSYCGKRFVTSEELLQHLRTHTSGSDQASLAHHSLFSRPGYPNPPLSPLSAARYHPYGKPPTLQTSPYSAFNPTALGPYYSAYSMYGQRIGAAVHQ